MRSFTVTDMQWHAGKLYVAGVSNGTFASSLRILGTPFDGSQTVTSVAMYHTTHNQVETRAPIRAMSFQMLNGRDTLVAAYLCSPIVTIPVDALKDGAHVEGKTIAELGYGDVANSMVSFSFGPPGQATPAILLVNDQREAGTGRARAVWGGGRGRGASPAAGRRDRLGQPERRDVRGGPARPADGTAAARLL